MKPTIDRRAMLKLLGGAALGLAASAYASAKSSNTDSIKRAGKSALCKPVISGALWSVSPSSLGAMSDDQIREELNEQRKIGFSLIWTVFICAPAFRWLRSPPYEYMFKKVRGSACHLTRKGRCGTP